MSRLYRLCFADCLVYTLFLIYYGLNVAFYGFSGNEERIQPIIHGTHLTHNIL